MVLGMMTDAWNPRTKRLKQEDCHKLEASQGYIANSCLQNKQKKQTAKVNRNLNMISHFQSCNKGQAWWHMFLTPALGRQRRISEFESKRVYKVSSRTARAT